MGVVVPGRCPGLSHYAPLGRKTGAALKATIMPRWGESPFEISLHGYLPSHRPKQSSWYRVKQFPSDTNRPTTCMIDILAWTKEVIRSRQPRRQRLGLTHEQQRCIAELAVPNVPLPRWRLLGRVALRLPMKQIMRDEVILIHRGRRILVFGLLQRHKEDIEFTILQMQNTFSLARPVTETPMPKRNENLITRIGSMNC